MNSGTWEAEKEWPDFGWLIQGLPLQPPGIDMLSREVRVVPDRFPGAFMSREVRPSLWRPHKKNGKWLARNNKTFLRIRDTSHGAYELSPRLSHGCLTQYISPQYPRVSLPWMKQPQAVSKERSMMHQVRNISGI